MRMAFEPSNSKQPLALFPRIKQANHLIVIVSINFINFLLYSGKKFYLAFIFTQVDYGSCKSSPSIFAEVQESVQVFTSHVHLFFLQYCTHQYWMGSNDD